MQRRLATLEEDIGRKLVELHPTGYRLTELGKVLFPHAVAVERAVDAFHRQVMSAGEELTGTLRVTCPEGSASRLPAPVIEAFRYKHTELRIDPIMTGRRLDFAKGEAEVALRLHEPATIHSSRAGLPIRHGLSLLVSRTSSGMAGRNDRKIWIIMPSSNLPASWLTITPDAVRCGPKATIAARGNSMLGVLAAVRSGAGLAPLPMLLGASEDGLVPVLASIPDIDSKLYLVMHTDLQHAPRVRAFCDFVVGEFARLRPRLKGNVERQDRPLK